MLLKPNQATSWSGWLDVELALNMFIDPPYILVLIMHLPSFSPGVFFIFLAPAFPYFPSPKPFIHRFPKKKGEKGEVNFSLPYNTHDRKAILIVISPADDPSIILVARYRIETRRAGPVMCDVALTWSWSVGDVLVDFKGVGADGWVGFADYEILAY
jgi:hypothetical protein